MSKKKTTKVKFKDLTGENKDYIKMTYYDEDLTHKEKMEILGNKFGVEGRTIRKWWLEKMDLQKVSSKLPPQLLEARDRNLPGDTEVLLVTSAQNETPINRKQLASMMVYKDFITNKLDKETNLVVIPVRYRNPTTPTEDQNKKKDMWWVDEVKNNIYYNKVEFGDTTIAADTHISPTAKMPLTGLDALSNDGHLILGAFRIHFKTQARLRNTPLRTMGTTGAITRKNYSRSKAGDTASIHHSYGFTIIELKEDGTCHVPRNIFVTDDGEFIDLCYKVTPDGVTKINSIEAIVWGDIHNDIIDENIYNKTKKLCKILKPKVHVIHDLLDGGRFNPHERKDVFIMRRKIASGKYLIEEEVDEAVKFPKKLLKDCGGKNVYVVQSNHDEFLDRHITDMNWKSDLHNSPAYLKYATIQQTVDLEEYGNIFGYLLAEKYDDSKWGIDYLKYGDLLTIKGFNLAMHGDHGTNGSRGSITQYKRLNFKMIHGHNHSPIIMDGVTSVGLTGDVKQYYTRKGVSTHAYAHCLVHENGKRQLLVFDDNGEISDLI
tara:strand:- start:1267 stop:2904 length:1638 start_codon:yes stop_codon:yes gene_type:complete